MERSLRNWNGVDLLGASYQYLSLADGLGKAL